MLNTNPTKLLAAIDRVAIVKEIITVDPEIKDKLIELAQLPPNPEMNHWQVYSELKGIFYRYVGWGARNRQIASSHHYEAFIGFLEALIPEDEDDLAS